MTDARAHVRITFLSRVWFILSILAFKESLMNGPFFDERDIYFLRPFFSRRRMMSLFEAFLGLRVRKPRAGWPHGVLGLPPGPVLPSPPPCGWSRGFIVEPLTVGLTPEPAAAAGLPPRLVLLLDVTDLPAGGLPVHMAPAQLARGHSHARVAPF